MDLFDKLRTAGPVDKKDFKRKDSEGKKKSSHDKNAENKHRRNSDHKHTSSSPDHKKKSSHDSIKKSSQGKVEENHKKKHSAHHGKGEESPSKKSYSSHGINKESSDTPSRKNSLQGIEKHKFDHRKKEESPSKHHKDDDTKKKSKHSKDVNSTSKSNSNHVETPSKRKSNTEKDHETPSKKNANHDRDLDNKNKRNSSTEQSPIKKKLSNDKDSEKSNKKVANHDKDTTANPRKSLDQKVAKFNDKHKTSKTDIANQRRESLPSPVPPTLSKKKAADKSRSLSPPKSAPPSGIKPLKIKLERKKLEEFNTPLLKKREEEEPTKKKTPTKAQQKLFEPMGVKKTQKQVLKEFNVKSCMVRIHRDNLKELMREFKKNKLQPKLPKLILGTKRSAAPSPKSDGSPPLKKGKMGSPPKLKTSFFIKLATPKLDKMKSDKKSKHLSKHASKTMSSSSSSSSSTSSAVAQHNKIKNSKSLATITPTKFSRSQLITTFGKHWFKSHVRIKRCNHPLMRTFESNARARRLQSKHNKSKNLSVSFRDQVEIFGGSSDSDDSYDENFSAVATIPSRNGRRGCASSSATTPIVPATPIVMPARLKKVENGRVVDDILLDPSLFLDPQSMVASTPYSPGRKKRDHKSFSPLKDEGTPSPRKEQLKLANERVPPTGLRRLNIEEEDDEDDDCEYIVPIELPQRRASRTSSTNTVEGGGPAIVPPTFDDDDVLPYSTSAIFNEIDEAITIAKGLVSPATVSSTNTDSNATTKDAVDADAPVVATATTNNVKEAATNSNNVSDNTESHESFQSTNQNPDRPISSSSSLALGDALNHVADNAPQTGNTTGLNGNVNSTLPGDLSVNDINLFIEDSQTNEDSPEKNYVDSIINETIDKLGRDMDSPASDENYRNAI